MLTALQSVPTTAKASTMMKAAKRCFISTRLPLNLHVSIFAVSNAGSITCWEACREPRSCSFRRIGIRSCFKNIGPIFSGRI
jgi:hypothetical protein